jgi:hypothetical protein
VVESVLVAPEESFTVSVMFKPQRGVMVNCGLELVSPVEASEMLPQSAPGDHVQA